MKRLILTAILATLAVPAYAAEKVTMKQLPKAAQETIRREMPANSKIGEVKEHKRGDRVYYKVDWEESDGTKYEMKVRNDGKILQKDTEWF